MTTAGFARFFSVFLMVGVGVATSCKDDDGDKDPTTAPACLISKLALKNRMFIGTDGEYTYTSVSTYAYDEKGNQTESSTQTDYTYAGDQKASGILTSSMQYDANDFLVRRVRQSNSTNVEGENTTSINSEEFSYTSGRLTKKTVTSTDNGNAYSFVGLYEYDSDGKLIKYSDTFNNSAMAITYDGKVVQKITITDAGGNVTSPFVQFNDKNWLIKSIDARGGRSDESRYEYTADGQVAREERYVDSKPSSATAYEYDTYHDPELTIYGRPKGHPWVPDIRAEYLQTHNIVRATYQMQNEAGTDFQAGGSAFYVYEYNAQGFPIRYTMTTSSAAGVPQHTSTATYEYTNCN
jgi:hypothetical protein